MYSVGIGKLRQASVSFLEDILQNLYNVKVKSANQPFKAEKELPLRLAVDIQLVRESISRKLDNIFKDNGEWKGKFTSVWKKITEGKEVRVIFNQLQIIGNLAFDVQREWHVENELFVGVVPSYSGDGIFFQAIIDDEANKINLKWDSNQLSQNFLSATSRLAENLRNLTRQPSPVEYLVFQLAYYDIANGRRERDTTAPGLGTPGFHPHSQTYTCLVDPGEGHVLGTSRFNEWMKGTIVHMEHLERPNHIKDKIEAYRAPSIFDFTKVRLHVGQNAPTTYSTGRCLKDSGDFEADFVKLIHVTTAAVNTAFYHGAAECKFSMEGLSTSQAVRYMHAVRGQVQKNKKQALSAAWNINQAIVDDYDKTVPVALKQRMEIATRALEITSIGGFEKIAWDGSGATYPSKCIMGQLNYKEALTLVHEAHSCGLVTFFSAGFKFDDIKNAVYAGVDGIGIGGAQVLRFMDRDTGMHGPYMEENIPRILANRDEAASSFRGKGVHLLARLNTMFYEGSITAGQSTLRTELFSALLDINQEKIEGITKQLSDIESMEDEGNRPYIGTAKRLIRAKNPLLKKYFESESEWQKFTSLLTTLMDGKDSDSLQDEYDNDPWLTARRNYWEGEGKNISNRKTTFQVYSRQAYN